MGLNTNAIKNKLVKFHSQILASFSKFLDCISEASGVSGAYIPSSSLSSGLAVCHCNLSGHLWGTLEINICHVEGSSSAFHVSSREATCISVIQLSARCGLISASTFSLGPRKRQALSSLSSGSLRLPSPLTTARCQNRVALQIIVPIIDGQSSKTSE